MVFTVLDKYPYNVFICSNIFLSIHFGNNFSAEMMQVSLAEALEVRGGPLQEEEVWAVLSQSAESLHELLRRGNRLQHVKALAFNF